MKIMLAEFFRRYNFDLIIPEKLAYMVTFLYGPTEPFKANLEKRN